MLVIKRAYKRVPWYADPYLDAYARNPPCKCSDRFLCVRCYPYWVKKSWSRAYAWLEQVRSRSTFYLFATFNPCSLGTWDEELQVALNAWAKFGELRSAKRRRKPSRHAILAVRRGIAGVHIITSSGVTKPHLHALFSVDRKRYAKSISSLCEELKIAWLEGCTTPMEATFELAREKIACAKYAVKPVMISQFELLKPHAAALARKHMVRRMGELKAPAIATV